ISGKMSMYQQRKTSQVVYFREKKGQCSTEKTHKEKHKQEEKSHIKFCIDGFMSQWFPICYRKRKDKNQRKKGYLGQKRRLQTYCVVADWLSKCHHQAGT